MPEEAQPFLQNSLAIRSHRLDNNFRQLACGRQGNGLAVSRTCRECPSLQTEHISLDIACWGCGHVVLGCGPAVPLQSVSGRPVPVVSAEILKSLAGKLVSSAGFASVEELRRYVALLVTKHQSQKPC